MPSTFNKGTPIPLKTELTDAGAILAVSVPLGALLYDIFSFMLVSPPFNPEPSKSVMDGKDPEVAFPPLGVIEILKSDVSSPVPSPAYTSV